MSRSVPNTGGVDRSHAASLLPKALFATLHAALIILCVLLAFGGFDWPNTARAQLLALCAVLYFARHLITLFVLLKRRVELSEVLGLGAFMALFEVGFLLLGAGWLGDPAKPLGPWDALFAALVLAGSFLNTGSEIQRMIWKRRPEAKGRCYTRGLFAYSMHINYFGDVVLFTGWALLSASLISLAVPLFMAASFVFFHIPALDSYLADRYGEEFAAYAAKTAKLIPFLY